MNFNSKIYKYLIKKNGDIHLEEFVVDIDEYSKEILDNGEIILRKKQIEIIDSLPKLKEYDFKNSNILYFKLCETEHKESNYTKVINVIYKYIDNGKKIMRNTKLNFQPGEHSKKGFTYLSDKNLQISFQRAESNKTICEILHQCIENKLVMRLHIRLNNNQILHIQNL